MSKELLFRLTFFFVLLILTALVQRFWFVNAWRRIRQIGRPIVRRLLHTVWWIVFVLLLATFLDPFLGGVIPRHGWGMRLIVISPIWVSASFLAFIAFHLVGLVASTPTLAARLFDAQTAKFGPTRRSFVRYAAYAAASFPFLGASYALAAGRFRYQVSKVDVPIANLPKALDGMKIVQLSDIHAGEFMPREEVHRAVGMANELNADLAVITGDFISGHNDPLEECIAELGNLRAPLGTWGCNGNHEIYANAEDTAQQLFWRHGMRLLRQESVQIEHRGAKFNLIGVDYQRDNMTSGPRGPMLKDAEHLINDGMPNILLSHNPNSFRRAAELGIELSLAGHTHGGQVKFEIVDHVITPARLITEFVAGLYHLPMNGPSGKAAALYVNRGLGTLGIPVRLGVPPEITLLTLRAV